jgi:hypothetical protein
MNESKLAQVVFVDRTKKSVWPFNVTAALLLVFAISLSSPDPSTRIITALSLGSSLGACFLSLRRRRTLIGAPMFLLTFYYYVSFLLFTLERG